MYHQVALIRSYKLHNTTDNSPKSPKGNFEEFCSGRTKPQNNLKCLSKTHKPFVLNFAKILQYIQVQFALVVVTGEDILKVQRDWSLA